MKLGSPVNWAEISFWLHDKSQPGTIAQLSLKQAENPNAHAFFVPNWPPHWLQIMVFNPGWISLAITWRFNTFQPRLEILTRFVKIYDTFAIFWYFRYSKNRKSIFLKFRFLSTISVYRNSLLPTPPRIHCRFAFVGSDVVSTYVFKDSAVIYW